MKYKGGTISTMEEGEEVDIAPKGESSVEVSYAVVFHDCGVYRVVVSDERIVITKEWNPNKWVPCSERLPEESYMYLVTIMNHLGYPQMEVDGFVHGKWERFGSNVLAWMPLPEPYEEKNNDN